MNPRASRMAGSRRSVLNSAAPAPPPRPPPAGASLSPVSPPRLPWPGVAASPAASAAERRLRGNDAPRGRRPAVAAAARDRVLPHLVDVEQEVLAVARRDVEDRIVRRDRILDRLPEAPGLR